MNKGTRRRLVIIDDHMRESNPGISSLVNSIETLSDLGWSIEVWAKSIETRLKPMVKFRRSWEINCPVIPGVLPWVVRHVQDGWRFLVDENRDETVYLTTGGHFLFADISIVQFYNPTWLRMQIAGVESGCDPWLKKWVGLWGCFEDLAMLHLSRIRRLLPASDAIHRDLFEAGTKKSTLTVPNCVDAKRFNPDLRKNDSASIRQELGIPADEFALLFVSQGHYTRKGFWLATKALIRLKERGETVKMYVLGGNERTLNRIRRHLTKIWPEWETGIDLVGWTDQVPQYMAATDALFMPSYFEAFSLVEIEATAMGLPLLLTPHHGSEMILEEGVNGISIPFDPEGIADCIVEYAKKPIRVLEPRIGRALSVNDYAKTLDLIFSAVLNEKRTQRAV